MALVFLFLAAACLHACGGEIKKQKASPCGLLLFFG
jgi:hypothetical protein